CIAAKRYGDSLLNVMLAIREPSTVPVGFLGFLGILERKTQLHQRLEEIMSQQHHVKRIGLIGWTLLLFLTLFVLPMAVAQKETPKPEEEAEPTKDKLIDGLFAYHTLIKTGTFTYQFGTMVTESDDYSQPLPWQDKGYGTPYTAELTVADNGWVMRWPTTPIVSMYHRDYSATYTETPQPEGETYRSLIIERSGRMNKPLDEEGKNAPLYEVVKAGAVPTPQMLKYMKKHRDRIEYLGKKTVRDIETHVVQLRIPKAEIDEFKGSFHPKELKEDFIVASFYVAPSLSFAAVKIVTWTPDGVTTHRYEATDFQEVAKGIFFPMRYYSIGDFTMHGNGYYIYQYLISELKNVNQPVPESNFEIAAPAGTRVRDSRSNDDNIYYIDKDTIFFQKVPGKTASTTHSDWFQLLNQAQQNYVAWDENQFAHVYDPKNYEVGDKRDEFEAKWVKLLEGTEPGHPGFEKLHPYDEAIIGLATIKSDKAAMLLVTIAAERVLKDNAHRHYATKALGMLGDPSVVPDVIPLLYHFNMNTRWDAQIALVRLTGQNFGRDAEAWGKWYNENRETLGRNLPAFDPAPVDWTCGSNDAQLQLYSTPEKQAEVDRQFGE
ncbi:MAG: HEAT repeat domain-containing protein, partial [Planctomycetaceae bacterium]|nr:HEAT repeat domain-containing protein [Planctomycetaceae bacterium]